MNFIILINFKIIINLIIINFNFNLYLYFIQKKMTSNSKNLLSPPD
jgi:hypothetical protein